MSFLLFALGSVTLAGLSGPEAHATCPPADRSGYPFILCPLNLVYSSASHQRQPFEVGIMAIIRLEPPYV